MQTANELPASPAPRHESMRWRVVDDCLMIGGMTSNNLPDASAEPPFTRMNAKRSLTGSRCSGDICRPASSFTTL
jgi:hypothetical protein